MMVVSLASRLRLLALTLAVGLGQGASAQVDTPAPEVGSVSADLLVARESVHPTGFPRILILDAPGSALVTFRLSIPIEPGLEGVAAAPILQRMAQNRIAGAARTIGARVEVGASATALSYTVTGALADLDHLAFLLRQATASPRESEGFAAVRGAIEARLSRIGETGEGQVESELRTRATPGEPSVAEIRERLRTFRFSELSTAWQASHEPQQMTLLVVGDVATPVLLSALAGLGAETPAEPPRATAAPTPPTRDRPDLLRRWIGFGWATTSTLDPRAAVAAALAAHALREEHDGYEAYVRLWEGRTQVVLALIGSAYGAEATALRRRLNGLPGEISTSLDAEELDQVVQRLHWNLITQARTPWGRANFVGRFLETGGTPDAARRYVDALLAVDVDGLRAFLDTLSSARPVTVEAGQ